MFKNTNFDREKALYATEGRLVVTDQLSPFEWVGSQCANRGIIIVIYGTNEDGRKVAVCGHLKTESHYSINAMLSIAGITDISSVFLISAIIKEEDALAQPLLELLKEKGVENLTLSLGKGVSQIAINVRTGQVSYEATFLLANAGVKKLGDYNSWSYFYTEPEGPSFLELSMDGRKAEHVSKVSMLLKACQAPSLDEEFQSWFKLNILTSLSVFGVLLLESLLASSKQKLITYPERKLITYPEWEATSDIIKKGP
ncbi:MAG: hypothetical protein EPN84_04155 [Legionella sp.]|nr:MAG: hypothetical protein EPN84_04155 [Legionella sp.]